MKLKLSAVGLMLVMLLALVPAAPAAAASAPGLPPNCSTFPVEVPAHQWYLICLPAGPQPWNGDVVIYAHGYVPPVPGDDGLLLAWQQLVAPDGTFIPSIVNQQGFVFAATTYRKTGLAVKEGLADTVALAGALRVSPQLQLRLGGSPKNMYLIGASEGGLITTLAQEQTDLFKSAVAACGPIGDFRAHLNYLGDFRVVFDYFFKNLLPGSAVDIPMVLYRDWLTGPTNSTFMAAIVAAMQANPAASQQLISVTKAAVVPTDPTTVVTTALRVLNYSVVATNESQVEIGTQPYTNLGVQYSGSLNDSLLNLKVKRLPLGTTEANLALLLAPYQTTGKLTRPLVTLHTLLDPEVPFWHEALYTAKAAGKNLPGMLVQIEAPEYGHCNFNALELQNAFATALYLGSLH